MTESDNFTPEEIAVEIMRSESMMWLMVGGDEKWIPSHLRSLREGWDLYVEAGGPTWGHPRGYTET